MDAFNVDINAVIFFEYLKSYQYPEDTQVQAEDKSIYINNEYIKAFITFNSNNIFEYIIENSKTKENEFYLHFQFKTFDHALSLFNEMIQTIISLKYRPTLRILLSCTGGLTTSYFAGNLNEKAAEQNLDYTFDAIGFTYLDEVASDYDVILLAPQISYKHANIQGTYKNKIVINIPPKVFAKYDASKMISIIEETQTNFTKNKEQSVMFKGIEDANIEVLTFTIIRNSQRIHVTYRLFAKDSTVLEDEEIIKTTLSIQDIFDVVDLMLIKYPHIDVVVLAIPGIINDGKLMTSNIDGLEQNTNLHHLFKQRYTQKFCLINDVNSIAVGYHACQTKHHNISVIFQPVSTQAGVGHIINDQLNIGYKSVSGEMQFQPLNLSDSRLVLNKTVKGTIELLSQEVISIIASIAPEEIVVANALVQDKDLIIDKVKETIPEELLPKIKTIYYLEDYSLIGCYITAINALKNTSH